MLAVDSTDKAFTIVNLISLLFYHFTGKIIASLLKNTSTHQVCLNFLAEYLPLLFITVHCRQLQQHRQYHMCYIAPENSITRLPLWHYQEARIEVRTQHYQQFGKTYPHDAAVSTCDFLATMFAGVKSFFYPASPHAVPLVQSLSGKI